jgi:hypothetical protein
MSVLYILKIPNMLRIIIIKIRFILLLVTINTYATVRKVPADFPTIQSAIESANDGDTVVVSPGKYIGFFDNLSKNITIKADGIRDVSEYILQSPDGNPSIFTLRKYGSACLKGFTLTGINGRGPAVNLENGTVENCVFIDCKGGWEGAAVSGSGILRNCKFNNCNGFMWGGLGGALNCKPDGRLEVINCSFSNTDRILAPSGAYANCVFANCLFFNNSPGDSPWGGPNALFHLSSGPGISFNNCTFIIGFDHRVIATSVPAKFSNCIFYANDNKADMRGILMSKNVARTITVNNSIYCGKMLVDTLEGYESGVLVGENVSLQVPRFANISNSDYQLADGSPGINEGDNTEVSSLSPIDFLNNPRVMGGIVDIGAFERFTLYKSSFLKIYKSQQPTIISPAPDNELILGKINYRCSIQSGGFVLNQTSGEISWTPLENMISGVYSAEIEGIRVSDNKLIASQKISVLYHTLPNTAPSISMVSDQSISEGDRLTIKVSISDPDTPEDKIVNATINGPEGMIFSANDGFITWKPKLGQGGNVYNVKITAADDGIPSLESTISFRVEVKSLNLPSVDSIGNPIYYVPQQFDQIQDAINQIKSTGTILVGPGRYVEKVDTQGKSVLIKSINNPNYTNCTIVSPGGISTPIRVSYSNPASSIEGFAVTGVRGKGPAIELDGGVVRNCLIFDCQGGYEGAAVSGYGLIASSVIDNCNGFMWGGLGGALACSEKGKLKVAGCRFSNIDRILAAANAYANCDFESCLFYDNRPGDSHWGGPNALFNISSGPGLKINNCTFVMDSDYRIAASSVPVSIRNSILFSKPGVSTRALILAKSALANISITDSIYFGRELVDDLAGVSGGVSVSKTVSKTDPYFVDLLTNNFRLRKDSPGINGGSAYYPDYISGVDLDLKSRFLGGRVDLGSYEQWSFYAERSLTATEGTTVSVKANAEDISAMGGVRFLVESAPEGLTVDPSTGLLTWKPTEAQGPGTYSVVIRGTAANNPTVTDTQTLTLSATEVNQAPQFPQIGEQITAERLAWTFSVQATDSDLPANRLTYRLVSGPSGAMINADSGLLKWTPSEAEGGNSFDFLVEATDNGSPALSSQTTVRLAVQKINHPPTMGAVPNASIPEMTAWSYLLVGQDLDLPTQTISYSLVSGPAGMSVNPTTGGIQWTPTEAQGPGKYPVTVRVQDPEGLTADQTFEVDVTEINTAPSLSAVTPQLLAYGQRLDLQLVGNDMDLPANVLRHRLVSGPTNAAVSADGKLTWSPIRSQAPSTNLLLVALSDGSLSVTNAIRVEVFDLVTLVNGVEVTTTQNLLPPAKVSFKLGRPDWVVLYSQDGTQPTDTSLFYLDPFTLEQSATVWPIAFSPDFSQSVVGLPIRVNLLRSQTLTLTGGQGLVYQGPGVAISATSDSGLPVALSVVSGPARLENGLLIPTGGGVVRLSATQAGNPEWAPASIEFERSVAKAVQTIAWTPVPEASFRSAPVQLKATASSGLAVTYSVVEGPGSIVADRLTLTGAGIVVVRATQPGTADFEPMTADQTVMVEKATQTLSFNPIANRVLGTAPVSLVGSASSGLAVVYEVLSGPAKVSGDQLTVTGVGVVLVRASQPGNANYEPALPRDQQFTVTQGQQTLTFASVGSKIFGDAPVTLSATSSAQLPVTYRVISGPGALIGDQLTLLGAGDIVVQASQAGNDQFQAVSANQTITVAKAAQVITFPTLASVGFSTNGVALEAKAGSGLPVSYRLIAGNGSITGSRLALNSVGSFSVAADQAGNTNWLAATSVTNSFTVTRGVQSIAFAPIGDQVLSVGSVTLNATSSAGLAVTYSVMSGPATVSGTKLTLLNEGTVVVRAINPGSTLWQAAQADQTFQIRKLTTLSVTIAGNIGGTVAVSPVKDQYAPTDTITLTATATNGFAFAGWSGDLTGAANPATLTMASVRSVTANFKDIQAPTVVWDQPVAGTTGLEQVRLSGKVSDNVAVTLAQWSRDGGTAQAISVAANGTFSVENLVLNVGTNRFAVTARDAAGNETQLEREVVWVPQRVLSVGDAVAVQEGQRLVFPLNLITDTATVAGLTFKLTYDPAWVADPQVEWGAQAGQSVNNVNIGTPGELAGSFALAGVGLPSGSNRIATVSFRARSVPFATEVIVRPTIVSLGSLTGVSLNQGNAAVSGLGTIRPRRIKGDNNANQRLDVGDAVLISRYEVGLEEKRSWDIGLNDLNQSGALDNGDVIKALRAVVGLDPQPTAGSESKRRTISLDFADALGLAKVLVNTNDVMALELIDGPTATVGQPYRVAVRLNRVKGSLSGLSFTVKYPASLSLTAKEVGALVPGDALPFWNEGGDQVSLAAIRSTAWANATGVAAVLTFVPSSAFSGQAEWPLRLEQSEITGSGFDVRPVDPVSAVIQNGGGALGNRPQITLQPPKADGSLGLEIRAPQGATVAVETTGDLSTWIESQRITGQGNATPVKVTLQADPNVQAKFWRVRVR